METREKLQLEFEIKVCFEDGVLCTHRGDAFYYEDETVNQFVRLFEMLIEDLEERFCKIIAVEDFYIITPDYEKL